MADNELVEKNHAKIIQKGLKTRNSAKASIFRFIVKVGGREIVFYCTGRKNAGENSMIFLTIALKIYQNLFSVRC